MNLAVEPELVSQMIADVEDSPGSLPLLQYTLTVIGCYYANGLRKVGMYCDKSGKLKRQLLNGEIGKTKRFICQSE